MSAMVNKLPIKKKLVYAQNIRLPLEQSLLFKNILFIIYTDYYI